MTGIVLGWCVVSLLVLAGLLQVAVIRDRTIHIGKDATSFRWVMTAGLWGLAVRFGYLLYDGHFTVPWHSLFCIGLTAFGLVGLELPRFVPLAFMETQPSDPMPFDEASE